MIRQMIRDGQVMCERRHETLTREAYEQEKQTGPILVSAWTYFGAAWLRLFAEVLRPLGGQS